MWIYGLGQPLNKLDSRNVPYERNSVVLLIWNASKKVILRFIKLGGYVMPTGILELLIPRPNTALVTKSGDDSKGAIGGNPFYTINGAISAIHTSGATGSQFLFIQEFMTKRWSCLQGVR